jgi:hypothetical protein
LTLLRTCEGLLGNDYFVIGEWPGYSFSRRKMSRKNAVIYRKLAREMRKMIPNRDLPMPAERFVRVLDALTSGLLFTYFQTPELISEEVFVAAFEALV